MESMNIQGIPAMKILIVDDSKYMRAFIRIHLERVGYRAVEVEPGSVFDVMNCIQLERPDLVITDHRLPGGWTAKHIVGVVSAHFEAKVPVVIMTGEVTTHLTEFAGGQLLAKPVAPDALLACIVASCQREPEMA